MTEYMNTDIQIIVKNKSTLIQLEKTHVFFYTHSFLLQITVSFSDINPMYEAIGRLIISSFVYNMILILITSFVFLDLFDN